MRIFCYFVEPASYTLDLARNIYDKNQIDYCFINSNALADSNIKSDKIFLDKLSLIAKFKLLIANHKRHDFIIINGYNNFPFIITFLINFFSTNKRFIATDSDTKLSIPANSLKRFIKWVYLSLIFRNKYMLGFAGGNASHKELFRYYGMKENKIFLMPMMVDNTRFFQKKKSFPDTFTFLYVGRLVKHKNVENLIKQFKLKFSKTSVVLKIIGGGNEESHLRQKYSSEKVLFLGKLFNDDLISEFKSSSCFVCPSEFEPWGLVVNEALSSGLPAITTKEVGANYDLIQFNNTGFIASDMDDFGDKMLEIYNNPALLMQFSNAASDFMKDNWNYDLYNKCLLDAIKKVEKWL